MEFCIEKKISHYSIKAKIGDGGMGVVYKAYDTKLERAVAIKLLQPQMIGDPQAKERFFREAKTASSLNHPNITIIYEIDEWKGQTFIVMEYVEGQTIKDMVKNDPLSLQQLLSISIQITDALNEAHAHNILHRDIKSDNIMIGNNGHVKVMDFGLAKMRGNLTITKLGTTLGTIPYLSPEQIQGKRIDNRSASGR